MCYDWLAVYDGPSSQYPLLGYFCGSQGAESVYSTGRDMTIKMFTDYSITKSGFRGNVQFVDNRKSAYYVSLHSHHYCYVTCT